MLPGVPRGSTRTIGALSAGREPGEAPVSLRTRPVVQMVGARWPPWVVGAAHPIGEA
jgi:hypothetical protein